jgi:hypothetical protein
MIVLTLATLRQVIKMRKQKRMELNLFGIFNLMVFIKLRTLTDWH